MTARRLTPWIVEEMVDFLRESPDTCLLLNPSMIPKTGMPRVNRDGRRIALHRYLYLRVTEEEPGGCLLAACPTPGCLNPFHWELSQRRGRRIITHCPNGHEYTPDNIERVGKFKCKQCRIDRLARRRKGKYGRDYCRHGHKKTPGNTYTTREPDGTLTRRCRTCQKDNQRRYRERRAQANG